MRPLVKIHSQMSCKIIGTTLLHLGLHQLGNDHSLFITMTRNLRIFPPCSPKTIPIFIHRHCGTMIVKLDSEQTHELARTAWENEEKPRCRQKNTLCCPLHQLEI